MEVPLLCGGRGRGRWVRCDAISSVLWVSSLETKWTCSYVCLCVLLPVTLTSRCRSERRYNSCWSVPSCPLRRQIQYERCGSRLGQNVVDQLR